MERIADVYLDAPRNLNIPSTPGRQIWFNGGKASICYEQDMPTVLRRDDVTIYPSERYRDWWEIWIKNCGEHFPARAKIEVDGVVHEPPYANLLVDFNPLVGSAADPDLRDNTVAQPPEPQEPHAEGAPQGAVQPTSPKRGRPKKIWAPEGDDGANGAAVDPDSGEAAGGSDPVDADSGRNDDDPDRRIAEAVFGDAYAGKYLGLRDILG